jgi:hypothetical protein
MAAVSGPSTARMARSLTGLRRFVGTRTSLLIFSSFPHLYFVFTLVDSQPFKFNLPSTFLHTSPSSLILVSISHASLLKHIPVLDDSPIAHSFSRLLKLEFSSVMFCPKVTVIDNHVTLPTAVTTKPNKHGLNTCNHGPTCDNGLTIVKAWHLSQMLTQRHGRIRSRTCLQRVTRARDSTLGKRI